jgi:hypothetical protein
MSDKNQGKKDQVSDKSKDKELTDEELKKSVGGKVSVPVGSTVPLGPGIPKK